MKKMHKRRSATKVITMVEPLENRWLLSAVPGSLNPAFAGGVVEGGIFDTNDATNLVVQSDGKIVIVGDTSLSTGNKEAFVSRFNQDGTIDSAFNNSGYNTFNLGASSDVVATSVALQSDGKIVVVGTVGNVSTFTGDFFVARLNTNGTLDTSFNSSGYRIMDFGGLDSAAGVVVDQTSGQIVIAGASVSITTGSGGIALAFVNPDGSMNTNIGDETGMIVTNPGTGTIEAATSLEQIGSDYLVSGFSLNASTQNSQMMLVEFGSNGRLNYAFGTKGRAFASFGNTVELGVDAAYDPTTGLIYEAGASANGAIDLPPGLPTGTATAHPTQSDFAIASFNADGTLNTNFNGTGEKTLDFKGNLDAATSVNVEGDGKIIVAGGSELSTGRSVTAIARLNPDGSLDTTFAPSATGSVSTSSTITPADIVFSPTTDDLDGEELVDVGDSNGAFHAQIWINDDGTAELYFVGHNKDTASLGDYYIMDLETGDYDHATVYPFFGLYFDNDEECVGPPSGILNFNLILSQPSISPITVQLDGNAGNSTSSFNFGSMPQTITFDPGVTSQTITMNYSDSSTTTTMGNYDLHLWNPTGAVLGISGAATRITYVRPNDNYVKPMQIMPIGFSDTIQPGSKTKYSASLKLFNNYSVANNFAKTKKGGGSSTLGLEKGPVTITIYGSRNQALDTSTDTVLGTLTTKISLKPQQTSKAYKVKLTFPAVTRNTKDFLLAAVTGTGVSAASTDFTSSSGTVLIQPATLALVGSSSTLPGITTTLSSSNATVSFPLTDDGSVAAIGTSEFDILVTSDGTLSGEEAYFFPKSARLFIKPGATQTVQLSFKPSIIAKYLTSGESDFVLLIRIHDSKLLSPNTTDGTIVATVPMHV